MQSENTTSPTPLPAGCGEVKTSGVKIRKIHVDDFGYGWEFFDENGKEIEIPEELEEKILDELNNFLRKQYNFDGVANDVVSYFDVVIDENSEVRITNIAFFCEQDTFDSVELPWKNDVARGKMVVDLEDIETIYAHEVTQITCNSFRIDGIGISGKKYEIFVLIKEKLIDPWAEDVLKAEWQEVQVDEVEG